MKPLASACLAVSLIAFAGAAGYFLLRPDASPPPPPADVSEQPAPSTPAVEAEEVINAILANLRSADPALRQHGQEQLASLPCEYPYRNWLRVKAEETLDPELKTLLTARIEALDDLLGVDPPPVSLHVKNTTLAETLTLLSTQAGGRCRLVPGLPRSQERYTLDADHRPFWEIIQMLNDQHPLSVSSGFGMGSGELAFMDARLGAGMEKIQISGPFMFCAGWRPPPTIFPGRDPAPLRPADQRYAVATWLLADPRLTLLEAQLAFEPVCDERGHVLYTQPSNSADSLPAKMQRFTAELARSQTLQLTVPDDHGSNIAAIKVKAHIVVAVSSLEMDIDDIENKINQPVTLGGTTFTLSSFTNDRQIMMRYAVTSSASVPYLLFDLYNKDQKLLARWPYFPSGGRGSINDGGGPFRLHLTAPRKTRTFDLDFEIKDWPFPA